MNYCIPILFLMFFLSCLRNKKSALDEKQNSDDVINGTRLYESGFLKFADTSKLDSLKSTLINSFDIYDEENNRIVHIDAEELAECSFDYFLPNLNKILGKRGVMLKVVKAGNFDKTNDILINGNKLKLFTESELNNEIFWDAASRNFFKEVNLQLDAQKLDEHFYLLYGGNDLHVLLLTVEQHNIIADKYKSNTKEAPYLP